MSKTMWKPGTFVYPIPAVMVSCGDFKKSTELALEAINKVSLKDGVKS